MDLRCRSIVSAGTLEHCYYVPYSLFEQTSEAISESAECNVQLWHLVTEFLTPALYFRFVSTLVASQGFPLAENERTDTLIKHNLSRVYVSCAYFHSRSNNNLQAIVFQESFKFYCDVLRWFSFVLNSIIRWKTKRDNFTFHCLVYFTQKSTLPWHDPMTNVLWKFHFVPQAAAGQDLS